MKKITNRDESVVDVEMGYRNTFCSGNTFGDGNTLGDRNELGYGNRFGDRNMLGDKNKVRDRNTFGDLNTLGFGNILGEENAFGDGNTLGDLNTLGCDIRLGNQVTLGNKNSIQHNVKIEDNVTIGNFCIIDCGISAGTVIPDGSRVYISRTDEFTVWPMNKEDLESSHSFSWIYTDEFNAIVEARAASKPNVQNSLGTSLGGGPLLP